MNQALDELPIGATPSDCRRTRHQHRIDRINSDEDGSFAPL